MVVRAQRRRSQQRGRFEFQHLGAPLILLSNVSLVCQNAVLCGNGIYVMTSMVSCKRQILDSTKLKEFVDDNLEFDKYSRKFSKRVENTVEKGEIACFEQFLPFPQCFLKTCIADSMCGKGLILYQMTNF